MNFKRLFYKTIEKNLEKITEDDRGLLAEVGIEEYPFFKFTKGSNTAVVYGYERGRKRLVIRFKSPDDPPYDMAAAGFLKKKKFCVAKFSGGADISDRQLAYEKTPGKPKVQIGYY